MLQTESERVKSLNPLKCKMDWLTNILRTDPERAKRLVLRKINSFVPVKHDCPRPYQCDNKTK